MPDLTDGLFVVVENDLNLLACRAAGSVRDAGRTDGEASVRPGQIWLVEQRPAGGLCGLDRRAVSGANVVIYDRPLAPMVARVLQVGSYAEPASRNAETGAAMVSPRALGFAAEGWSVVQLVEAGPGQRERIIQGTGDALIRSRSGRDLPVQVIAKAPGDRYRRRDTCLCKLPEAIAEIGGDDLLTVVFGPLPVRCPPSIQAFTANGLAG